MYLVKTMTTLAADDHVLNVKNVNPNINKATEFAVRYTIFFFIHLSKLCSCAKILVLFLKGSLVIRASEIEIELTNLNLDIKDPEA